MGSREWGIVEAHDALDACSELAVEPLSPWERGWGEGSVLARAAKLASQRSTDPRYSPFTASTTFSTVIPKCLNS
jgi:hypothetical protein